MNILGLICSYKERTLLSPLNSSHTEVIFRMRNSNMRDVVFPTIQLLVLLPIDVYIANSAVWTPMLNTLA